MEYASEDEDPEAGQSRRPTVLELPMLTVTSPSPRKGRKDVKGKGKATEVGEEDGLLGVIRSE